MQRLGSRAASGEPPEWVVYDDVSRCPYLTGRTARLPLRLPMRRLRGQELTRRLAAGDRRQGVLLYRPDCPTCRACEPIRIDAGEFVPSRTHRRIHRRGARLLETAIGPPTVSADRVALYNEHKIGRGLLIGNDLIDRHDYAQFLVETCTDTIEITYRDRGRLVAVAIADRAADALSAVYCFFDPRYAWLSPGTYSILQQLALCRQWGLRYLYLGLYVDGCSRMEYKARFLPHERLIDGRWQRVGGEPTT